MTRRPANTYRAARRNRARKLGLVWRYLQRVDMGGYEEFVIVPE